MRLSHVLDCIKLIEEKGGIIEMINEEVKLPKGSDKDLLFKIEKNHGKNPFVGMLLISEKSVFFFHSILHSVCL
jgi:hypothetical protein